MDCLVSILEVIVILVFTSNQSTLKMLSNHAFKTLYILEKADDIFLIIVSGVCTSVLKKICRENGLERWPYRKVC